MLGFYFHEDNENNVYIETGEQMDRIHGFIVADMRIHRKVIPMQPQKGSDLEDFLFENNNESIMRSQIMADLFTSMFENVREIQVLQVIYTAVTAKRGHIDVKFSIPESRSVLGHNLAVSLI